MHLKTETVEKSNIQTSGNPIIRRIHQSNNAALHSPVRFQIEQLDLEVQNLVDSQPPVYERLANSAWNIQQPSNPHTTARL
jgi:hypothetical protein